MLNISEIISKNNLENIRKEFQVEVILFLILQKMDLQEFQNLQSNIFWMLFRHFFFARSVCKRCHFVKFAEKVIVQTAEIDFRNSIDDN